MPDGKYLGYINKVYFGNHPDLGFGLFVTLTTTGGSTDTSISLQWPKSLPQGRPPDDWTQDLVGMVSDISSKIQYAGVWDVNDLKDKPIEATFERNLLKSWRILNEVIPKP